MCAAAYYCLASLLHSQKEPQEQAKRVPVGCMGRLHESPKPFF